MHGFQGGVPQVDYREWDKWTEALAQQQPFRAPGTTQGYHALTFGWLVGELIQRVDDLPATPIEALALARDLCDALDGEQQLWLIGWWQHRLWRSGSSAVILERLDRLRGQLLCFVQPRLAWEVALLDLSPSVS